ncbi:hypothetical protein QBC33DRAFT_529485 [Phialemonium atrogriseum]|uniref:Uncharacterized protein n=1 Tax=Phialemonium atrogriseum TaxID=1093897 RepID=A0AAJ0C4Q8_9PEZI|nr:uncharacterized protein QBC33DRAFT_529485 [Phialemonium atrogriseum]KAK1769891.1 hypothetical protein QBC33DRAFT_529485 [Phialemonium atrogriseum]
MGDRYSSRDEAKRQGKKPQSGPDQAGNSEVIPDESVIGRITSSAAGLAGAVLGGPSSNAALAASLSGEKGQASTANDSAQRVGESSVQWQPGPSRVASFRPSQSQAHVAAEEAAFASFLDNDGNILQAAEPTDAMDRAWQPREAMPNSGDSAGDLNAYSSVTEQQKHDGQAVVTLLSEGGDAIFPGEIEDESMTPQESEGLRRALFGDAPDAAVPSEEWDNVLNFVPEYLRLGVNARYWEDVPSNSQKERETSVHVGVSDPGQAWQVWVGQWSDVLTRYTDEVWGDLSSLVEQARSEVAQLDDAKPEDSPPQTKALRRLRAILGHLRGQQSS